MANIVYDTILLIKVREYLTGKDTSPSLAYDTEWTGLSFVPYGGAENFLRLAQLGDISTNSFFGHKLLPVGFRQVLSLINFWG